MYYQSVIFNAKDGIFSKSSSLSLSISSPWDSMFCVKCIKLLSCHLSVCFRWFSHFLPSYTCILVLIPKPKHLNKFHIYLQISGQSVIGNSGLWPYCLWLSNNSCFMVFLHREVAAPFSSIPAKLLNWNSIKFCIPRVRYSGTTFSHYSKPKVI